MPSEVGAGGGGSVVLRDRGLRYRPYLDGLRTVAVYLVVAFHAGLGLFSGGFIGVDVFFVLSGFLVTRILMRDLASLGRIRWRQFYSRRVRRIVPAALVTLVMTALVYSIVATPAEMLDALGGFRAAFFYVANWFFIRQSTDYFAANVNSSPVLHFWSLAIEEQFYLVWPLLLGGLYVVTRRAGRRRWWVVRSVVVVAAAASASAALHLGSTNIDRAYYGTDTRAYELLAGAGLALTPQLLRLGPRSRTCARWLSGLALGGLLVLATSAFDMSPITRGVLVAGLAPVLIIALENTRRGFAKRVLSSGPFTYLGRISYGTYLWHWPVIVIVAHGHDPNPVEMFAICATTATALAAVSFHLIEHPIRAARTLDRFKAPVIAIGFATSILIGALAMPTILDRGGGDVSGALVPGGFDPRLRLLDWRKAKRDVRIVPDCIGKPVDSCIVVKGSGKRVLLMGDSHARMWVPAFTQIAQKEGLTLALATDLGCPWQRGLKYNLSSQIADDCSRHQTDWYNRVVPQFDPDILILVHQAYDDPARPHGMVAPDGDLEFPQDADFERMLSDATTASLQSLRRPGRTIVLGEPIPESRNGFDPLSCLSEGHAPKDCVFKATRDATGIERAYRSIADGRQAITLNLDKLVCPRLPICDSVVGNIIVFHDASHLTATIALALAPQIDATLRKEHALGGP